MNLQLVPSPLMYVGVRTLTPPPEPPVDPEPLFGRESGGDFGEDSGQFGE